MAFELAAQHFINWCTGDMLPLWAQNGVDRAHGGFYERLNLDGSPDARAVRRVRVTSRQIYAFSHASLLGWAQQRDLVGWGVDYLVSAAWRRDGEPGFVHLLDADGGTCDARRDLYDHAFHIMALSWASRACDDAQMLHLAQQTLAFVDEAMGAPDGGWREGIPASLPRRQNPHMHMLEALLALYEASRDEQYLHRADTLIALMQARFVEPQSGLLLEDFDDDLSPVQPPRIEPGHIAEWCWLLHVRARLGQQAAPALAADFGVRADGFGKAHGGFLPDAVNTSGEVVADSRRLWGQTEWLKSMLVRGKTDAAARLLQRLEGSYLDAPVAGLWMDAFDLEGHALCSHVPASIVYHLLSAAAETQRVLEKTREGER